MPERPYPHHIKVAFSFAGEQRLLVEPIAVELEKLLGFGSVFYDAWFEPIISGPGGDLTLQEIYTQKADLVVVCISGNYDSKYWPQIEWDAIRSLNATLRMGSERDRLKILPIRVGEGDVKGFFPTTICPDVRSRTPEQSARLIEERFKAWSNFQMAGFQPSGLVLLMPAVARFAGAVEDVRHWLRDAGIAVIRLNMELTGQQRTIHLQQAVAQADAMVDWVQDSQDELDQQFLQMAAEIRAVAASDAAKSKRVLRWQPVEIAASESDSQDLNTRRFYLEAFKKELLKLIKSPAAGGQKSRLVFAAAGVDEDDLDEILNTLPPGTPIDAQVDEAHTPQEFKQTPDWDDLVKAAVRRQSVRVAVFVDGLCTRNWIDRRLRAYDVYREELAAEPALVVYDIPPPNPPAQNPVQKPPRRFWPGYAIRVVSLAELSATLAQFEQP